MAYERLFQTSFETGTTLDWASETSPFYSPNHLVNTPSLVQTGVYAINAAESRCYFGNFKDINHLSVNYFLRVGSFNDGTTLGRIFGYKAGLPYAMGVYYDDNTKEFYIADSNLDEYEYRHPVFLTSFATNNWMPIGITAKCGEEGWLSLYVDGERVIKFEGHIFDEDSIGGFGCGGTFGLVPSSGYTIDDVSIDSCTEDESDKAPHSPRFYAIRPNSRGLYNEWVPVGFEDNYHCVVTYNDNTDNIPYVFAEYNNLKDTYRFPAPIIANVVAMIPTALLHGGGSLFGTEIKFVTTDGTDELVGSEQEVGYGLDILWERFATTPSGAAWTPGNAGEIDFGFISVVAVALNLIITYFDEDQIDMEWNDIESDEDGYSIERSLNGLNGWHEIATVTTDTTTYSDTSVLPDTQYWYRVRAYRNA